MNLSDGVKNGIAGFVGILILLTLIGLYAEGITPKVVTEADLILDDMKLGKAVDADTWLQANSVGDEMPKNEFSQDHITTTDNGDDVSVGEEYLDVPHEYLEFPVVLRLGTDDLGLNFGQISYCLAFNEILDSPAPRKVFTQTNWTSDEFKLVTEIEGKRVFFEFVPHEKFLLLARAGVGGQTSSSYGEIITLLGFALHRC